jgi:predicted AlkP superfamily pyrophosphatase or phosphodiesterase
LTCLLTGFLPGELGLCGWKYVNVDKQQVNLHSLDNAKKPREDVQENSQAVERDFASLKPKADREFTWFVERTWAKKQSAFLTGLIFQACSKIEIKSLKKSKPPGVWDELVERIKEEEFTTKLVVIYLDYFDEQSHQKEKPSATSIEMYYKEEEEVIGRILEAIERRAVSRDEDYSVVITADHGKFTQFERDILSQIMNFAWTDSRKAHLEKEVQNRFAPLTGAVYPEITAKTYGHWLHDVELADVYAFLKNEWEAAPDVIFKVDRDLNQVILGNPLPTIRLPNVILLSKYDFTRQIFSDHGGVSLSEMLVPFIRYRIVGT